MVYATQAYPSMKPYLKGFHLSLETWRGGQDAKGWRLRETPCQDPMDYPILEEMAEAGVDIDGFQEEGAVESMDDIKLWHLIHSSTGVPSQALQQLCQGSVKTWKHSYSFCKVRNPSCEESGAPTA
jgi:hypothetical protein